MLLLFYEAVNTFGGTSLSNALACLTCCCCNFFFVVVVVKWGGARLSLQPWEGCLDAPRVPPNRPSLGEGRGESLLFRNLRLCFPLSDVYECLSRKSYQI